MQGMLTTWVDFDSDGEHEFNEWYNTEHLLERAQVPGFYNARRYIAVNASPKYMALYDTESPDVLTSDAYAEILNNPTPWSQKIMPQFRNFVRCTSSQIFQWGQGWGQIALSLRISIAPEKVDDTAKNLIDGVLNPVTETEGVVGVFLMRPIDNPDGPAPAETSPDQKPVTLFLNVACIDMESSSTVLESVLSPEELKNAGIPEDDVEIGTYRFVCGVDRAVAERE